jgi:hypothetical protein
MRQEQPGFEAGTYRETVKLLSSSGWAIHDTVRLTDIVGIPPIAGSVDVMRSRLSRAVELSTSYDEADMLRVIRILSGPSDKLIEKAFSRIEVARMPFAAVQRLINVLRGAIDFGRERFAKLSSIPQSGHGNFWVDRLRVLVEVLSRLVVRLNGDKAIAAFREAVSLAHASDWGYWALFEPLGKLLSRALLAVPPRDRRGLLLEILNLPLPDERGIHGQGGRGPQDEWPEVMTSLPGKIGGRGSDEVKFAARVAVLILKLIDGDPLTRERAAFRLACLQRMGSLSPEESISFGQAVWSRRESDSALPPKKTGSRNYDLFCFLAEQMCDLLTRSRIYCSYGVIEPAASKCELRRAGNGGQIDYFCDHAAEGRGARGEDSQAGMAKDE